MKKLLSLICTLCFVPFVFSQGLSGSTDAKDIHSVGTQAEIIVKKGNSVLKTLKLNQYTVLQSSQKTLIEFTAPTSIKGSRFLNITNPDGSTEQYVYLPALHKIQKIKSKTDLSESFMGTDFSYADISFIGIGSAMNNNGKVIGNKKINGKEYMEFAVQMTEKTSPYSQINLFINANGEISFINFYNKEGKIVKKMSLSDYQTTNGIPSPHLITLETLATGTTTSIVIKRIVYNMKIPGYVFTPQYLREGK